MKTNVIASILLTVYLITIGVMVISYNQNELVFGIAFFIFLLSIVLTGVFCSDRPIKR